MDFDLSTPSVTSALGELQYKVQSTQEDRAMYAALQAKATASFERHRAELTLLLQKERAMHAAAQDKLREELQKLLKDNAETQAAVVALQNEKNERCKEEVGRRRRQHTQREATLHQTLLELKETYKSTRADTELALEEKRWHEMQLRETLHRQGELTSQLQQLKEEIEIAEATRLAARRQLEQQRRRSPQYCIEKVFLPAGVPDYCHTTSPSSHHIAAIVSTVERQNCYKPRLYYRRRGISSPMDVRLERSPSNSQVRSTSMLSGCETRPPPLLTHPTNSNSISRNSNSYLVRETPLSSSSLFRPSTTVETTTKTTPALVTKHNTSTGTIGKSSNRSVTNSTRHLEAVCRSLLREILQLRREYKECTSAMNDPGVNSVDVSRRMREIMKDLDRKVHQLRNLRQQQAKVEDKLKLHDMMMEIAAENNYCESIYSDLLELIRS